MPPKFCQSTYQDKRSYLTYKKVFINLVIQKNISVVNCREFYSKEGILKDLNYIFIINPTAGQGRTNNAYDLIRDVIAEKNVNCEFKFTSQSGDATQFAREAAAQGFTHIISVGGDGTSHEVVNGLIGSSAVFGVIPSGSGNDFPKAASIALDMTEQLLTGLES